MNEDGVTDDLAVGLTIARAELVLHLSGGTIAEAEKVKNGVVA